MPTWKETLARLEAYFASRPRPTPAELQRWVELEEAARCPHCGLVVLCGPPCCAARAQETEDRRLRELGQHPEQIAARRAAKRERRLARREAKRACAAAVPAEVAPKGSGR